MAGTRQWSGSAGRKSAASSASRVSEQARRRVHHGGTLARVHRQSCETPKRAAWKRHVVLPAHLTFW